MTNPNPITTPPILINNPLTLFYWIFFRPFALRRYARSIDEELDQDLKVWEVRENVEHDARFKALCRARLWLLVIAPLAPMLLTGSVSWLFTAEVELLLIVSLFFIGYLVGVGLIHLIYWYLPQGASRWRGASFWLIYILSSLISFFSLFSTSLSAEMTLVAFGLGIGAVIGTLISGGSDIAYAVMMAAMFGMMFGMMGIGLTNVLAGMLEDMLGSVVLGILGGVLLGAWSGFMSSTFEGIVTRKTTRIVTNVALSLLIGLGLGVLAGLEFGMAVGFVIGLVGAALFAVQLHLDRAMTGGVKRGLVSGALGSILQGITFGFLFSFIHSVINGITFGIALSITYYVAFIAAFLRLPFYLVELPYSFHLSYQASKNSTEAIALWPKQPLHYDEVIQLPLIGLPTHLFAIAKQDTDACLDALADVAASLRQQWAIPQALSLILFDQVERTITVALIKGFYERTEWLMEEKADQSLNPSTEEQANESLDESTEEQENEPLDSFTKEEAQLLKNLRNISKNTLGGLDSATGEAREQLLREVVTGVQTLRLSWGQHDRAHLRWYAEPLRQWKEILEAELERIAEQREVTGELPMRYIAGTVLKRGTANFKGRQDVFGALEGLLVNQTQKITPLLLGQPRTGKSSVLKQLPLRLGAQVLPVYLDMERRANSNSTTSLFADLAKVIRKEALQHPESVSLPSLDEQLLAGDPYRVFENWLEEVEKALGERRWLLLTLDEFNHIDNAVRSGRWDERIFSLLRSLIQHHPQVGLALCGTFSLSECDPRWYEALKSVRKLPVSYFKAEEARHVFTSPAPDFPENVYSKTAIERALAITGKQPFLIQLLGESIINDYNHSRRNLPPNSPKNWPLPVSAVENAIPTVLTGGETFFMSLWQWLLKISHAPEPAADLLIALARQQPIPNLGDPTLHEELLTLFCERDLLIPDSEGTYRFQVPLVAEWIRRQRRLPRVVV